MMRVISLGAGVQSTALAIMAAHGEITPMPDCAIFADTGWEPKGVYDHLNRIKELIPFPVHIVSAGNIRDDILAGTNSTGQSFSSVPWFTPGKGMGRRQCTREYKLDPIARKLRELLGYKKGQRIPADSVEVWIGISTDEIQRMKDSRDKWQKYRWPLIEMNFSRQSCSYRLAMAGINAPKSSCIGCPYKTNKQWRELRDYAPQEWADAIRVDWAIRDQRNQKQFMHKSCIPISGVDLSTPAEKGQVEFGFVQECDGVCGL